MAKQYSQLEIAVIYLDYLDVVTTSGDNYENDPWGNFEF